jgi:hypothetical protein
MTQTERHSRCSTKVTEAPVVSFEWRCAVGKLLYKQEIRAKSRHETYTAAISLYREERHFYRSCVYVKVVLEIFWPSMCSSCVVG